MDRKTVSKVVLRVMTGFLIFGMATFGTPVGVLADEAHIHASNPGIIPAANGNPAVQNANLLQSMQPMAAAMNSPMMPQMDPHMAMEQQAVLDLVKYADVTHTFTNATGNGLWSDASNWASNGARAVLPTDGSKVLIAAGQTVIVDQKISARLYSVRVDGTLQFATDRDTQLLVDTVVVTDTGRFYMGTATNPIDAKYEAKLTFLGDTDIANPTVDPERLSRGFISLPGSFVSIVGASKTPFVTLDGTVAAGSTTLTLHTAPIGWQEGDVVVLAGTVGGAFQSEEFLIKALNGSVLTLDKATQYGHILPLDANGNPYSIHLANISRNATLQSEALTLKDAQGNYDPNRMGHVMFMHHQNADIQYASFFTGRTDKIRLLFKFDPNDPTLGENRVGRYALHFHRAGTDPTTMTPTKITGIVAAYSPGLGLVNHSSYLNVIDSISYKVSGAGFFTEVGDEIGSFSNLLAIGGTRGARVGVQGFSDGVNALLNQSFGTDGTGLWLQGAGVTVDGFSFADTDTAGLQAFTVGLVTSVSSASHSHAQFTAVSLLDPMYVKGRSSLAVGEVPLSIKNVYGYGYRGGVGLQTRFHRLDGTSNGFDSTISNVTLIGGGINIDYTKHLVFKGVTIRTSGTAVSRNNVTGSITYRGFDISGFNGKPAAVGIEVPVNGANVVEDSVINAVVGLRITNAQSMNRSVAINKVTFGPSTQSGIELKSSVHFKDANINKIFVNDPVLMSDTLGYNGKQLYWDWQNPGLVPFSAANGTLTGTVMDGLTTQQLWDTYGLAPGGTIAPSDFTADSMIKGGGVGSPTVYRPAVTITSKTFTNIGSYTFNAKDVAGNTYTTALQLVENAWNRVTYTIGGNLHTHWIYYDTVSPTIQAKAFDINPLDIRAGAVFQLKYYVVDQVGIFTVKDDAKINIDLSKVSILTDSTTGGQYFEVTLNAKDSAGNRTSKVLRFNISATALRLIQGRNYAPRTAPKAVTRLLAVLLGFRANRLALIH